MKTTIFKSWLVLFVLMLLTSFSRLSFVSAQSTANYAFSTNATSSLVDMTTGTTSLIGAGLDAIASPVTPIGFTFPFMGATFTQFSVNEDGVLQLGGTAVATNIYTLTGGTVALPRFAAFNADMRTGTTTGKVHYKVVGTAPNRELVVEFANMQVFYTTAAAGTSTFQIILSETTGAINFIYGAMNASSITSANRAPSIGFYQGAATNSFATVNYTTHTSSVVSPYAPNALVAAVGDIAGLNSTANGSRRNYSFVPAPIPNAPTSLTFSSIGTASMILNWIDNSASENGFKIYRSVDGITYTAVGQTVANTTNYSATGLSPATLYYWKVNAFSELGESTPDLIGSQATNVATGLSGIKTVGAGGDYSNLTIAFAEINGQGLTGNLDLQMISGYPAIPETYPIVSCNATATGTYNVKVYPTVSGLSITSSNTTGTLQLNGATNLMFDGRVNQVGAKDLVISNTNSGASYAVQFVNDSRSNTLQYLTIHSANTSTSSGTIVFGGSTGTTGNDNNLIDHCDIKEGATTPLNAIYSAGQSTTIDNSGNTVSNSNIFNYYSAGSASNGVLLASNSSAWTINANKFFQTVARTSTAGNTHRAINVITSSGNGYVITGNTIGYSDASGTGVTTYAGAYANRFLAIELTTSNSGTASSVQGNQIAGISLTTTSGATTAPGIFAGISVLGGTVSIGDVMPNVIGLSASPISTTTSSSANVYGIHANSSGTLVINNNTIGSISGTGSVAGATCHIYGINSSGSGVSTTISGNTIGGTVANAIVSGTSGFTTTTSTVMGINTGTVTTYIANANTISNLTVLGAAGSIYGISSGISQYTISNNVIHDLAVNSNSGSNASVIYGIYDLSSPTVENVTNNQIYNLSIAGTSTSTSNIIMGIQSSTTASSVKNFSGNRVNGLSFANSSTGTAAVTGISSSSGVTISIFKNKLYNLSSTGTGSTVNGILVGSGTTANIFNNVIGDLRAPSASAADVIRGISITSNATSSTYRVYYNSVYLNASSTGTNFGTSGVYHAASGTATTAVLDLRNNIIINESTPSGTGFSVAFRRSAVALGNFASTSNRNLLYAGAPSATHLLMYDGTNSHQTMTAYQTAVSPREANTFTGEALFTATGYGTAGNFFISTTPSNVNYLKPVVGITSQVESGAVNITTPSITDDYAAVVRHGNVGYSGTGTAPDLGAFEFEGVTPAPVITLNSITPAATQLCVAGTRLISVDITTTSGTVSGAILNYTVNGVAQSPIVMTNTTGVTWEGTIPVPSPVNASVSWSITASSSIGINGSYIGTTYTDEPLFGTTSLATASSTVVCATSPTSLNVALNKSKSASYSASSSTSNSAAFSPFYHGYGGVKTQYIYRASELTAMGFVAGNITSLALNITILGTPGLNGFTINVGHTAQNAAVANAAIVSGLTQVYSNVTQTLVAGTNTFNFSTPFNWDGTSNIVISFSYSNNNSGGTSSTVATEATLGFTSSLAIYADGSSVACLFSAPASGQTCMGSNYNSNSTSTTRPYMIITGNGAPAIQTVSWSDGVTTVGTTNPLTVNPIVSTTYTATVTAAGCTVDPSPSVLVTVNPLPSTPTAVNSAQCGVQIPTAHVTSTSGLTTPTFNWYAASSGGTALQSSTSTTYTSTVGTTTTFYVSELNTLTGCESVRVPVTVTVSTPDAVSLTASDNTLCIGESVTLTATNTGTGFQSYTYSVISTAGSGAEVALSGATNTITPTVAGIYVYDLTAVDGGCAATASVTVTVNELPVISSTTAQPSTVCSNETITLGASLAGDGSFVVGAGGSTGSTDYYNPFYHNYGGVKTQYLITAAELTAAGLTAGNITALALNVGTNAGTSYSGATIHVGATSNTVMTTTFVPLASLTQVYANSTLTFTASSLNTFTFATPFVWDGTSNLVVQFSWSNNNGGGTSPSIQYDATSYVSAAYARADNQTVATVLATTTAFGTLSSKPKMTFVFNNSNAYSWSWSPGTGLNTANTSTSITNNGGSPISQVFTVTTTKLSTGCSVTATTPAVTINNSPVAPVASNSTQCGTGIPTASVLGSGTPGNTFSWYLTASGGTPLAGETASSLTSYSISTTTTFYVLERNANCSSERVPVTVTVTPPPAITISGTTTICNGESTTLSVSSSNDPDYTYTWSGGLGAGNSVTVSPTSNTVYTVNAVDLSSGPNSGCVASTNISVTVNPLPQSQPIVSTSTTICNGEVQNLTSGPATSNGTAIIGTGTTAPSTTSYPNPLSAYYGGVKHQILFTATELTAQGLSTGSQINSVAFNLSAFTASACTNFTIRMGTTSNTALTGFVTGTSTVYGPTTFTPSATGLATFTFSTPFIWDGTSNVILETVHNAGNGGNGSGTRTTTTTTTANTVYYGATDNVTGGIAGFDALTSWTSSGASNLRPNVRFAYSNIVPTWSPAATLYTNAGATTAYTGTSTNNVYAKPTTTTTYVATYTGSNGCTAQSSMTITVNEPTVSTSTATECGSYAWNGTTYTTSGTYTYVTQNAVGCDSTATLQLTINPIDRDTVVASNCVSYTWAQTGETYNASGFYHDTLQNMLGCDSIITLNLTIYPVVSAPIQVVSSCDTYTWSQTGLIYNTSGLYHDTLQTVHGCDSIITLNLTINQNQSAMQTVTNCGPYTWSISGVTYTTSGSYTDTIPTALGCDSIITLNLTINPAVVATATNNGNGTITASTGSTYQWINCATNTPISGATAQIFTATVNGSYAVIVSNGICSDTSSCVAIGNLDIKEDAKINLSVHPNPTKDVVIVTMDAISAVVEVLDAQGKVVQVTTIKSGDQISLGSYERGVYVLVIKTESGTSIERIIKN